MSPQFIKRLSGHAHASHVNGQISPNVLSNISVPQRSASERALLAAAEEQFCPATGKGLSWQAQGLQPFQRSVRSAAETKGFTLGVLRASRNSQHYLEGAGLLTE